MVPHFKSLVRPVLEYGNVVLAPSLRKNITCIWVSGAKQKYPLSKANVKHDEHGHQMNEWP